MVDLKFFTPKFGGIVNFEDLFYIRGKASGNSFGAIVERNLGQARNLKLRAM